MGAAEGVSGLALVSVDWDAAENREDVAAAYLTGWTAVYRVAWIVRGWPRRLGGGATSMELATDKKAGNKVAHLAMLQMAYWGGGRREWGDLEAESGGDGSVGDGWAPEERSAAAVLDWFEWVPAQLSCSLRDEAAFHEWCVRMRAVDFRHKQKTAFRDLTRGLAGVCQYLCARAALVGEEAGVPVSVGPCEQSVMAYNNRASSGTERGI